MAKLVSKTYGDALFHLAVEKGVVDSLTEEVEQIIRIWEENPELADLLTHPKIPKEQRMAVVKEVFHDRASQVMEGFLFTLMDKDRIGELKGILLYYIDAYKEYKKIGVATVTTAVEMTEDHKKRLVDKLLALTRYVEFEINYQVDEALIGGMVIRIGDRVLDSSVKHRLNAMSRDLAKIQL